MAQAPRAPAIADLPARDCQPLQPTPSRRPAPAKSEHLDEWFTTAQEKHANAVRLAFAFVAVLLAIHLTTISQYVLTQHQLQLAREDTARLQRIAQRSRVITQKVGELHRTAEDDTRQMLDHWVEDLRGDFQLLNGAIAVARGEAAPERRIRAPVAQMNLPSALNAAWAPPEPDPSPISIPNSPPR